MSESYDLAKLDAASFEHMVNALALHALGLGHTGFGPGSDGGRDGFFEREAPYPSGTERWRGRWYIQSKFHKPHLSHDPQKWLLEQIKSELAQFGTDGSRRKWPDNWIVATNIDPSGVPETGAFDAARALVKEAHPKLEGRFHIWGGAKILDLLTHNPEVARRYGHFLTPGHVLSALYNYVQDERPAIESVLSFLIARQFDEQQHTRLEQAGSPADVRPGIHHLFIDLPFGCDARTPSDEAEARSRGDRQGATLLSGMAMEFLVRASGENHRLDSSRPDSAEWRRWRRHPARARVWFVKGGPGQGKSTVGQYFCQLQRASLILQDDLSVAPEMRELARKVKEKADPLGFWPSAPRIPIAVELKDYAQWLATRRDEAPVGILTYLASRIEKATEVPVSVAALKRALGARSWFVAFDGLDEVPHDRREAVAQEVRHFLGNVAAETGADLLALCTSRPQGYTGQFSNLDGPTIELAPLSPAQALQCARPVIEMSRSAGEAAAALNVLTLATQSESVRELMATPLQAHIMAVVVRDGQRPPERRWKLFTNFYEVIRRREANRNLPDARLARLLREEESLLKTVHTRLGWVLHARAETSAGAQTDLHRDEFRRLVEQAVEQMVEDEVESTVEVLMKATTDRLVLVSTPDDGDHVRFHIRPLQEFFAAEFLYESVSAEQLRERLQVLGGDAHWREVIHFLLSALVENNRQTELSVAVDVLEAWNQGDEAQEEEVGEDDARPLLLLYSRLARGAIAAARLLHEGVLEQDRRVRERFRNALQPLIASPDSDILWPLIATEHAGSRRWLLHFVLRAVRESSHAESVGAAIVLIQLLEDDDEARLLDEARGFFLEAPANYLSFVLSSISPYEMDGKAVYASDNQVWLMKMMAELLLRPSWRELSPAALSVMLNTLTYQVGEGWIAGQEVGISDGEEELLLALAPDSDEEDEEEDSRAALDTTDYGIATAWHFAHDWTTGTFGLGVWTEAALREMEDARGILQWARRVLLFGASKQRSDLHAALEVLGAERAELLQVLPASVRAYLPIDAELPAGLSEPVTALMALDEEDFRSLLSRQGCSGHRCSRPLEMLSKNFGTGSLARWKPLVEHYPLAALDSWVSLESASRHTSSVLNKPKAGAVLIDKILQRPEILARTPLAWGKLMSDAGERQAELRECIIGLSGAPVEDNHSAQHAFPSIRFELPEEALLLPHWLSSAVGAFLDGTRFLRAEHSEVEAHAERFKRHIEATAGAAALREIAQDKRQSLVARACAALMFVLHPHGDKYLAPWQSLLVEAARPEISEWYIRAVAVCLRLVAAEEDRAARMIAGGLLERTRALYKHTRQMQRLLDIWRESSRAPATTAQVQQAWLAGS